jgi:cytochrome c oxidase assembly protein subunit 15
MSLIYSKTFYYRIAQITPFAIFLLMMLGSYTKSIGAGLACPDWPLCYNQIIPTDTSVFVYSIDKVMAEFIHRFVASLVSVLLISLLILSFVHRNEVDRDGIPIGLKRLKLMIFVIFFLAVQVIFGALTVLLLLEPAIVSIHLGVATIIFGGSIFLVTSIKPTTQ